MTQEFTGHNNNYYKGNKEIEKRPVTKRKEKKVKRGEIHMPNPLQGSVLSATNEDTIKQVPLKKD